MRAPHDVERLVGERQVERIALPVADQVRESGSLGEHRRDTAILVGQIDAGDTAAEFLRETARRAADAGAHVEDVAR